MNERIRLSILIPTHARPRALDMCLARLAAQDASDPFEILIGLDGDERATPDPVIPEAIRDATTLVRFSKVGLIEIRRVLLDRANAETILWINDDAHADPSLVSAHIAMHTDPAPRVVAGAARWKPIDGMNLFDALVQKSDLLFFQQDLGADEPSLCGYRSCFGLNMSFPKRLAHEAGGIPSLCEVYGYEDIELAYRLAGAGAELWYEPRAIVTHDHRYRPRDVLRREYLLGRSAWGWARVNPGFAADLFGRDIRSDRELDFNKESLVREFRDAVRIERSFLALETMSPSAVGGPMLAMLVEHWILLKRYLWRWGLLDAAGREPDRWSLLCGLRRPPPHAASLGIAIATD